MKKAFFICFVLMMVAPLTVMAQKQAFDDGLYWELSGGVLTISGNGPMKDYSSPWEGKGAVVKVVIENGVTSIGKCCFWEYNMPHNLKSVVIGNSVKSIGESAFQDCSSLTSVSIPNSVTSIGESAFFRCSSLTSVSIPNSVTSIGESAFFRCSSLSTIHSLPISILEGGESEWNRISLPKEVVYKYIAEHRNEERIRPIALANEALADIKAKGGYSSAKVSKNGTVTYYLVTKNSRYGLVNATGQEIVEPELDVIEECGKGFLRFKVNGYWGVMNYMGKIIIPTDRGYTKIGDYVSFTKRFSYEMDGYRGECNNLGQQVSKIKVGGGSTTSASNKTSSSSSSSSSSNSSSSSSNSNNSSSSSKTQTIVVEHHRDPVPVQEWQQCTSCYGSGQCNFNACCGSGWYFRGDKRVTCVSCHGSGKCSSCAGKGGHYITVYR